MTSLHYEPAGRTFPAFPPSGLPYALAGALFAASLFEALARELGADENATLSAKGASELELAAGADFVVVSTAREAHARGVLFSSTVAALARAALATIAPFARELDAVLRFTLERIERAWTRSEAAAEALRRFGDSTASAELLEQAITLPACDADAHEAACELHLAVMVRELAASLPDDVRGSTRVRAQLLVGLVGAFERELASAPVVPENERPFGLCALRELAALDMRCTRELVSEPYDGQAWSQSTAELLALLASEGPDVLSPDVARSTLRLHALDVDFARAVGDVLDVRGNDEDAIRTLLLAVMICAAHSPDDDARREAEHTVGATLAFLRGHETERGLRLVLHAASSARSLVVAASTVAHAAIGYTEGHIASVAADVLRCATDALDEEPARWAATCALSAARSCRLALEAAPPGDEGFNGLRRYLGAPLAPMDGAA